MTNKQMITIKNLNYQYDQFKTALKGLNLMIESGKIYVLAGQNGAGKTTLFKLIQGLIFKDKGTIEVLGNKPEDRNPEMLAGIFMVTDHNYLPKGEILDLPAKLGFYYPNFDIKQFEKYLFEFNLSKLKKTFGLSQGEKKKLTLAFGLATNVPLLLLDEPTNALDIEAKNALRKMINQWISPEKTCIIASHQIREIDVLIDHFLILHDKQIKLDADVSSILNKLNFSLERQELDLEHALYYEKHATGYETITLADSETDSLDVNFELLYNAFMHKKEVFIKVFEKSML
jgi:ABC-2 type transport system ATP-binding protein